MNTRRHVPSTPALDKTSTGLGVLMDKCELACWLDPSGKRITPATVDALRKTRRIPALHLGYRTILYDPTAVLQALKKLEVKAID